MRWFEIDQDYFSDDWLGFQLLPEIGLALVLLAVIFAGLHMLRRAFGGPLGRGGEPPPAGAAEVRRWSVGPRLYHWGNAALLLGLVLSGLALFAPGLLPALQQTVGISWLLFHEILAGLFIVGLIVHIVAAIGWGDTWSMWFARGDGRDLGAMAGYYAGTRRDLPGFGKYDPWQKIFHAVLALLSLVVIFTGVSLFLNAEALAYLGHGWLRWQRLIHDVAAFAFMAVLLGHVYVRLARLNWPKLRAMFTGRLSAGEFRAAHDWRRWQPEVTEKKE